MHKTLMIGLLFAAAAVVVLLILNLQPITQLFGGKPAQIITANIKLVNKCPMPDDVFILEDPKSGRMIMFKNGFAKLEILEGSLLQLKLSKSYPEVNFNGPKVNASNQNTLVADCSADERVEDKLKSIGGAFKKND